MRIIVQLLELIDVADDITLASRNTLSFYMYKVFESCNAVLEMVD